MNKYTLFGAKPTRPIILPIILCIYLTVSCDPDEDKSSSNNTPARSVLHLLQNHTTQYAKYQKGKEYKSAEWDGNVLTRYNADKTVRSKVTYDYRGRITKYVYTLSGSQITDEHRYEGDGNAFTFYDRIFLTRNGGKEYRYAKRQGNVVRTYDDKGNTASTTTFDSKGRFQRQVYGSTSYTYRSVGDGPEIAAIVSKDYHYLGQLKFKFTTQYIKEGSKKEWKVYEWIKEKGQDVLVRHGYGKKTYYYYDAKARVVEEVEVEIDDSLITTTYRYE